MSDKLSHVLSKLQGMVIAGYKATPLPLPNTIDLIDISPDVSTRLRDKIDATYSPKEITMVLTFKLSEGNMVALLGIARRCWDIPTLEYERAFEHGLSYKGFELNLATTSSSTSTSTSTRLGSVCETIHIAVTNLQKKVDAKGSDDGYLWNDWILSLPSRYKSCEKDFDLPAWLSDRSIRAVVTEIIERRKLVNIAQQTGNVHEPKPELPPLEQAHHMVSDSEQSKSIMNITNNFYNIKLDTPKKKAGKGEVTDDEDHEHDEEQRKHDEEQRKRYEEQRKHDDERKERDEEQKRKNEEQRRLQESMRNSEGFLGTLRTESNDGKNKMHKDNTHLLDSSTPSLNSQLLMMPRQLSPPRPTPASASRFPPPPYPWTNASENPAWNRQDHQATLDWYNFMQLERQMQERAEFARFQKNIESAIDKKKRENHYEEIPDAPHPKPLFHVEMPHHFQPLFEKTSESNVASASAKQTSQPLFERAPGPSVAPPPARQTFHDVLLPPPTSINLNMPPPNQFGGPSFPGESETPAWSGLKFLGPRFPSLEREGTNDPVPRADGELLPRLADKKKIESLREITEEQLKEITSLEGDIHESIYHTRRNQPPCSLLTNPNIMAATECPELLPGDLKDRINKMKEILELMETTKNKHIETLRYLQQRPHQNVEGHGHDNNSGWEDEDEGEVQQRHRVSSRLANKDRLDYRTINKRGFSHQEY